MENGRLPLCGCSLHKAEEVVFHSGSRDKLPHLRLHPHVVDPFTHS